MYKKLRDFRIKNNISVEELCNVLRISDPSNYYRRENGETKIELEEAKDICAFLKVGLEIFDKD